MDDETKKAKDSAYTVLTWYEWEMKPKVRIDDKQDWYSTPYHADTLEQLITRPSPERKGCEFRVVRKTLTTEAITVNQSKESELTVVERLNMSEKLNEELYQALDHCVYGLGCQPGYVNSLALQEASRILFKTEEYKKYKKSKEGK